MIKSTPNSIALFDRVDYSSTASSLFSPQWSPCSHTQPPNTAAIQLTQEVCHVTRRITSPSRVSAEAQLFWSFKSMRLPKIRISRTP